VWARYADGTTEPALSCASCHARPDTAGRLLHGAASDFDLGALVGEAWGPGRVDVTTDGEENPVAMPDLRASRHQRRLHHSGNLYNSLGALAVRLETLLITARAEAVRPPREIAFALAYYVWSLGGDEEPAALPRSPVFHDHCGRCHFDVTGAGDVVPVLMVGTDAAAGADSHRRVAGGSPSARRGLPACPSRPRMYHVRTEGGRHEVDLLLELSGHRVIGIEVKAAAAATLHDARHLEWLRDQLGERFVHGLVMHAGPRMFELSDRITAAPISTLWS